MNGKGRQIEVASHRFIANVSLFKGLVWNKKDISNMSKASGQKTPCNYFDGVPIPAFFPAEMVQSIIDYKPKDDDIFIVTFPKCGTTWSHHTLELILRHGENFGENFKLTDTGPFLEVAGAEGIKNVKRPCAFKTHLPFRLTPWSDKAKYIYVTRNPKDTCVSFYHHMANMPVMAFNGTFDEFFEHFISGDAGYGDYFDHLEGWYEQRNRPNVLFVTYEEMKEDPEAAILKMASFVDDEKYAEPLRKDRQKLENVVKYSSFEKMKADFNKGIKDMFSMSAEDAKKSTELPEGFKAMISKMHEVKDGEDAPKNAGALAFVRKGIIGDWRNHFSEEQSRRLDEKFEERTKNIEIANIWKQYM
ncbi:hypothetical protein JTE90_019606 [Oedothorax gibbosus]|uniref:Sulfotransferase domain-containing protein n=1 Tax=Oedothorax gibbosus TaxID=931172 RepID=A0AAV6V4Z2_9ARAC|nr:hypothetical protein JTE90_019606 [Oedothorax gibbosus]